MAFVPPYCPNTSAGYATRPASNTEKQRIRKACQELELPLDTIDFQSSRVQNADNIPIETRPEDIPSGWKRVFSENKSVGTSHNLASGKLESDSIRYVPLLIEVEEGDNTADVISERRAKVKENFANAKYRREEGKKDTSRFIFPLYFEVPDTQHEVLALLNNCPEQSMIQQLELPSHIEPLLARADSLGPADNTKRSEH